MAAEIQVRRARLKDAQAIADFVNRARLGKPPVTPENVAERFGQIGFLLAEVDEQPVGLVGWQVENLVIRVSDFLLAPTVDRMAAGQALISAMEEEGQALLCEVSMLFLPLNPSPELVAYWQAFGYEQRTVAALPKVWRQVVAEAHLATESVMVKQLREDLIRKPF